MLLLLVRHRHPPHLGRPAGDWRRCPGCRRSSRTPSGDCRSATTNLLRVREQVVELPAVGQRVVRRRDPHRSADGHRGADRAWCSHCCCPSSCWPTVTACGPGSWSAFPSRRAHERSGPRCRPGRGCRAGSAAPSSSPPSTPRSWPSPCSIAPCSPRRAAGRGGLPRQLHPAGRRRPRRLPARRWSPSPRRVTTAAIVLVVVLLIDNQVEAHVLQPFLVGRYVRLHPFVVAVVITAGALLGGLAGALLAVPFTAGPLRRPHPPSRTRTGARPRPAPPP